MSFYLVVIKFMITKNSVMKSQNLTMNHKSGPVKSNPDTSEFLLAFIDEVEKQLFIKQIC